ncbi:MAG: CRISPR-associated protein Cas2 [Kiloniellaceae bacterium]|nr:CRISPR-associated protein Cas2 [Kiloniellaceae bacterium]
MTSYTLSYDLRNESGSQDYEPLWKELKRLGAHRTQDSLWLINVNNTAKELQDHFKQYVDADDRLMVSELTHNQHYSNAYAGTNDWIKNNPPSR